MKPIKKLLFALVLISVSGLCAGCQIVKSFQATPLPLESATPEISLDRVTDIPTLPPLTPTPTLPVGENIRYRAEQNIFEEVSSEIIPDRSYSQAVIRGYVTEFTTETDAWGNTTATGAFTLQNNSGSVYEVSCDDACFHVDQEKNLIAASAIQKGMEVLVFGASAEETSKINADMIAVRALASTEVSASSLQSESTIGSSLTYTEYELDSFPQLNPISVSGSARPRPTSTPTPTEEGDAGYGYGYGYGYDSRPTSTPNRPTSTPAPDETASAEDEMTLNDRLSDRLNHSLSSRADYAYGSYGEKYAAYIEYNLEGNRDPEHPTRAMMDVESNDYPFYEFWFPYTESPMYTDWGILCYGGDWYMPMRLSVDIDPDPDVTNIVYTDRTYRSQSNYDEEKGYLRSFGYSIIDSKLFYFYQKEDGYGISIGLEDYDLGFDDIPFGYIGEYTEMNPFYSDDLITFFGHRDGRWYYVELTLNEDLYNGWYYGR